MNKQNNTDGLRKYQKKLNSETQEKVLKALSKMVRSSAKITVKEVAEKAGVAVMTIYNNRNLWERIYQAKEIQNGQDIPKAKKEERNARINEFQETVTRLRQELSDEKLNSSLILGHLEMEGKSWVDAVKKLLDINPASYAYQRDIREDEELKNGEFMLPEKNNTFRRLFAYLIGRRKIDKEIVYDLVKRDKLYENKYRSCVFVGYDREGFPRFASIRSTNTQGQSFRCDVANSDKSYSFCIEGNSRTVCIFEAPIDLMSYLTFIKLHGITNFNDHMLSLGGLSDKALERYLKDYPSITRLTLCLDNDEAGRFASEQLKNKYRDRYEIRCHLPKAKDWNEELVNHRTALEQQEGMIRAPDKECIDEPELLFSQ